MGAVLLHGSFLPVFPRSAGREVLSWTKNRFSWFARARNLTSKEMETKRKKTILQWRRGAAPRCSRAAALPQTRMRNWLVQRKTVYDAALQPALSRLPTPSKNRFCWRHLDEHPSTDLKTRFVRSSTDLSRDVSCGENHRSIDHRRAPCVVGHFRRLCRPWSGDPLHFVYPATCQFTRVSYAAR